jgi:hypothetical protein
MGDPAEIQTRRVKKQKTDRQDAPLLLRLLREDNSPKIWVPRSENRDLRQLSWHRHRFVQMRTRIMNQLQAIASNEGQRSGRETPAHSLGDASASELFQGSDGAKTRRSVVRDVAKRL